MTQARYTDTIGVGTIAAELEEGHEASTEERLLDAGVPAKALNDVMEVVAQIVEPLAWHRCALALRQVLSVASQHSPHGAAIHACILGDESLAKLGDVHGVSKQRISQLAAQLAPLFPKAALVTKVKLPHCSRPAPIDGDEWVDGRQAIKLGVPSQSFKRLIESGELRVTKTAGKKLWYLESTVLAVAERLTLEAAEARRVREEAEFNRRMDKIRAAQDAAERKERIEATRLAKIAEREQSKADAAARKEERAAARAAKEAAEAERRAAAEAKKEAARMKREAEAAAAAERKAARHAGHVARLAEIERKRVEREARAKAIADAKSAERAALEALKTAREQRKAATGARIDDPQHTCTDEK
jgi:hypothetical protein